MKRIKKLIKCSLFAVLCAVGVHAAFAQSRAADAAFAQGADAFKTGNWQLAMMSLRKAASHAENDTAETWYMLITSEMYGASYAEAVIDCDYYLRSFPDSMYVPYVQYQKGRALFYLGDYEKAVLLLSDFCHQHRTSDMYASALFWIAESFYYSYNYNEARSLYERIVSEFPEDAKAAPAQLRIETIAQRTREEKLLYLLKKTGEAYLSAKEGYEKQLKMYDTVSVTSSSTTQRAADLQQQNEALTEEIINLRVRVAELESTLGALQDMQLENAALLERKQNEEILRLKEKARQVQNMLDGGAK
ncbi:MAG: tetratricopeptide repeat protein [Treponema sp.]|nr:tetratricopeptide repeat protein [Treponema sp.]